MAPASLAQARTPEWLSKPRLFTAPELEFTVQVPSLIAKDPRVVPQSL